MMEMEQRGLSDNGYVGIVDTLKESLICLVQIPPNDRDGGFKGAYSATLAKLGLAMCLDGDTNGLNHIQTATDIEKQEDVDVQSYFYYSFHIDKAVALFDTEGSASEALKCLLTGIYGSRSMGHTQRARNGLRVLAYAVKTYGVDMVRSVLMEYKRGNRSIIARLRGHRH
jgi:hypothetical protein